MKIYKENFHPVESKVVDWINFKGISWFLHWHIVEKPIYPNWTWIEVANTMAMFVLLKGYYPLGGVYQNSPNGCFELTWLVPGPL